MISIYCAFVLDTLLGDPYYLPHPVRIMGGYIKLFEGLVRKYFKSNTTLKVSGVILTITTIALAYFIPYYVLVGVKSINYWIWQIINVLLLYTCLAAKCLSIEAYKIYKVLRQGDMASARKILSYIVGRDTDNLDEDAITKATIETVAENTSDGVIAPLLYMFIGGVPLVMAYKAINTLDSMVGYRNQKYMYFGWASAKLDDVANYIPARLTALFMIAVSSLLGLDSKRSLKTFIKDKKNHKSPNSGCPESATAGALGIQLGGTSLYFGKPVVKPTIGENIRPAVYSDIEQTVKLMYGASVLALICFSIITVIGEKLL